MTTPRWLMSAFIAWHLASITFTALPTGRWVARVEPPVDADTAPLQAPDRPSTVTRAIDALSRGVAVPVGALRSGVERVLGRPIGWYVALTGLAQNWAMFSNPPQYDRYWRVRYYVEAQGGRPWTATELIGPSHREDRVRLVQSYRDSYRDKAFEIAFDGFVKRRRPSAIEPGARPEDLPDDLAPIGRYFARHFAARLQDGERITRTEVWVGTCRQQETG